MPAGSLSNYEVYAYQRATRRWVIQRRFPTHMKDEAIDEAKDLFNMQNVDAVRVIRESYDPNSGATREVTIFSQGKNPDEKPDPPRDLYETSDSDDLPEWLSGDDDDLFGEIERRKRGKSGGLFAPKKRKAANSNQKRRRRKPTSGAKISAKLMTMILVGLASGALIAMGTSFALKESAELQAMIPFEFFDEAVLFGFVAGFLGGCGFAATKLLIREDFLAGKKKTSRQRALELARQRPGARNIPTPLASDQFDDSNLDDDDTEGEKSSLEKMAELRQATEELKQDLGQLEGEEIKVPQQTLPEDAEADSAQPSEQDAPQAPIAARHSPESSAVQSFVTASMNKVKSGGLALDSFSRFGITLFVAGACEYICNAKGLDLTDTLKDALKSMGYSESQALGFAGKFESYLGQSPQYAEMFEQGRIAGGQLIDNDTTAANMLALALKAWNKPKEKTSDKHNTPVTIMFTDIVGSTDMTSRVGDEAAQKVVHAHNRIVREALQAFGGREVKHTGDGIMASFKSPSKGVLASMDIQRNAIKYSKSHPDLPVRLKIGLNSGEPIAENDDFYGTTVQLAARICDKAGEGQVFVPELVRALCQGKNIQFEGRGKFPMKGIPEPVPLYEALW